jgi:hypothetical protein
MRFFRALAIPLVLVLLLLPVSGAIGKPGHRSRATKAVSTPSGWVAEVTNPYFPLRPGTTFHYTGETDGIPSTDDMEVTRQTKVILGVRCTVVHDRVYTNGLLSEDTLDWYAQDTSGNVWYFGEDTKELDSNGNVTSTEGSWLAGVNGAHQGIIMEAHPRVGDHYQQEFAAGVAEDMAQVLGLHKSACVMYGCFDDLLLTKEWSPLEKGVTEHKYYARDVGFVLVDVVKGGDEHSELLRITRE